MIQTYYTDLLYKLTAPRQNPVVIVPHEQRHLLEAEGIHFENGFPNLSQPPSNVYDELFTSMLNLEGVEMWGDEYLIKVEKVVNKVKEGFESEYYANMLNLTGELKQNYLDSLVRFRRCYDSFDRYEAMIKLYEHNRNRIYEGLTDDERIKASENDYTVELQNRITRLKYAVKLLEYCQGGIVKHLPQPAPVATSIDERAKTGRTKDPEVQKRNLDIRNAYAKYKVELLTDKDALDRVCKSYKRHFKGEYKNIKDQIRRIIKATQSDTN